MLPQRRPRSFGGPLTRDPGLQWTFLNGALHSKGRTADCQDLNSFVKPFFFVKKERAKRRDARCAHDSVLKGGRGAREAERRRAPRPHAMAVSAYGA